MDAHLSIVVYRGDPVDLQKTRHTAIYLIYADGSRMLIHVTGIRGEFILDQRPGERPDHSQRFVKDIPVAVIKGKSKSQVQSMIAATPVKNNTYDWDCQKWVGDALVRLSNLGWITPQQRSDGIAKMVDVVFEAQDED